MLTPQNVPKMSNDNGWGIHWGQDIRPNTMEKFIPIAQQMHLTQALFVVQSLEQTERITRQALDAGILPIIRPISFIDRWSKVPWYEHVKAAQRGGSERPLIQVHNEPSDDREWVGDFPGMNYYVEKWIHSWSSAAGQVLDAGGYPGIQCLDTELELRPLLQFGGKNGFDDVWFCGHPYALNHPPLWHLDKSMDLDQICDASDDLSIFSHYAFDRVIRQELGRSMIYFAGEGGFPIGCQDDMSLPKITPTLHRDYHLEWYNWFRTGYDSLDRPLQDWYRGIHPWIFYGDWWHWEYDAELTIQTLKDQTHFIRGGGSTLPPPVDPPPQPPPIVTDPNVIYDPTDLRPGEEIWVQAHQGQRTKIKCYCYGEKEAQGRDVVYVRVEYPDHSLADFVEVHFKNGGDAVDWTINGTVNFTMYGGSIFDPNGPNPRGPHTITVDDAYVDGVGLPVHRHWQYLIVATIPFS